MNNEEYFTAHFDATHRFDYFLLGASLTAFAYITNSLPVSKLGANAYTINVAGLVLLAISIFAGFWRLQSIIYYLNFARLD